MNSIQIYLYSAFYNTCCFKAALKKVHFRKIQLVNSYIFPIRFEFKTNWEYCQCKCHSKQETD